MMRTSHSSLVLFCALGWTAACSSDAGQLFGNTGGTAGSLANGGSAGTSSGGRAESGGSGDLGGAGATSAEGGSANGGSVNGGSPANGGSLANGGSPANGGAPGFGGGPPLGEGGASGSTAGPLVQSGSRIVPLFMQQPACQHIDFPAPFQVAATQLRVLTTLVHPASNITHDASSVWTRGITATGFDVCVSEDGGFDGEHPRSRVDWVAMVAGESSAWGFVSGRTAFSSTNAMECASVAFPSTLSAPVQLLTGRHYMGAMANLNAGAAIWVEALTATEFRLCARQLENSDAALTNIAVDWAAYLPSLSGHGFAAGEVNFGNWDDGTQCNHVETGCANCENVQVSVNHRRRTEENPDAHGATLVWVEDFDASGDLTVCVRESSAENLSHDSHLSVDWLVRQSND
ncbi:MAG: hypothetical protein ACOY0T_32435 [Myxococcota bacterium]